jgi:hypothetical protein
MGLIPNTFKPVKALSLAIFILAVLTAAILFSQDFYVVVHLSVYQTSLVELTVGFIMWESQSYAVWFTAIMITVLSAAMAGMGLLRFFRPNLTSKHTWLMPLLGLTIAVLDVAAYVFERNWQIAQGWGTNAQWPGAGFVGVLVSGILVMALGFASNRVHGSNIGAR